MQFVIFDSWFDIVFVKNIQLFMLYNLCSIIYLNYPPLYSNNETKSSLKMLHNGSQLFVNTNVVA